MLIFIFMTGLHAYSQPIQTVKSVDLQKYSGKWYEIAAYPQRFQKNCYGTTALYTVCEKGYVIVENSCHKDSLTGKTSSIKGKAFVVTNSGNAKLKVQFFWPFVGKYWIIDLAEDYSFAVVSHPNKNYLWILSRTPKMSPEVYDQITTRLSENGFDFGRLKKTPQ